MSEEIVEQLKRIADALELLVKKSTPFPAVRYSDDSPERIKQIKAMDRMIEKEALPTVKEVNPGEKKEIVWVEHDGKKFKMCRYKCGNYVSWDKDKKKYIHYGQGFGLIGDDCPKYAEGGDNAIES